MLDFITSNIPRLTNYRLQFAKQNLDALEKVTVLLNITSTLQRGFAIVTKNGEIVRSTQNLSKGDQVTTRLSDGEFNSKVE